MAKRKKKLGVEIPKSMKRTLTKAFSISDTVDFSAKLFTTFCDGKKNFRVLDTHEKVVFVNYDGEYFIWDIANKDGLSYGRVADTSLSSLQDVPWEEVNINNKEQK